MPQHIRRGPRRRRQRGVLPWVVLISGWTVAGVALVVAAVFGVRSAALHAEAQEREDVHRAAQELVLRLTTFEGERIEEWVEATTALATEGYAEEVTALFDPDFRETLRETEAASRGDVLAVFVQGVSGDEAAAYARVRQTVDQLDAPVEEELRMELMLERVRGDWLVAGVAVIEASGAREPGPEPDLPTAN